MARSHARRLVCIFVVGLALPAPAHAKAPAIRLQLAVPTPGHITVAVNRLTVAGRRRHAPKVVPQGLRSLPPSVRVIYARRVIRTRRTTTFALALIAVNVAPPAAQSAADPNEPAPGHLLDDRVPYRQLTEAETVLLFMGGPVAIASFVEDDRRTEDAEDKAWQAALADIAQGRQAKARTSAAVRSVIDPNGDGKVDPGLDTGHYDDGHAFGWGIKSKADEKKTWADLNKETIDVYLLQLEERFKYDIDGDGTIESPRSGGQQIDTQVGPPVVTGGGS